MSHDDLLYVATLLYLFIYFFQFLANKIFKCFFLQSISISNDCQVIIVPSVVDQRSVQLVQPQEV